MALPDFVSPRYEELREWWVLCGSDVELRRAILEVVRVREALQKMKNRADAAFDAAYTVAPGLTAPGSPLWQLRCDIEREVRRAGTPNEDRMEVYVKPPPEIPGEMPSRRRRRMRDGRT